MNWKGGKTINTQGYVMTRQHEHPRSHNNYVREHIIVFEEYYKCCVLKWGVVHHINGIKTDNRIENLQLMSKKQHDSLGHGIKHNCSLCGSSKTASRKSNSGNVVERWYTNPFNRQQWLCIRCIGKIWAKKRYYALRAK